MKSLVSEASGRGQEFSLLPSPPRLPGVSPGDKVKCFVALYFLRSTGTFFGSLGVHLKLAEEELFLFVFEKWNTQAQKQEVIRPSSLESSCLDFCGGALFHYCLGARLGGGLSLTCQSYCGFIFCYPFIGLFSLVPFLPPVVVLYPICIQEVTLAQSQ